MPQLPEPKGVDRWLTKAEIQAFGEACEKEDNPHILIFFWLSVSTGGRKTEILPIRKRHVDVTPGAESILLTHESSKGQYSRRVGL